MIEPEVTGSGVEDGAEDDEGVMLGAVKVMLVQIGTREGEEVTTENDDLTPSAWLGGDIFNVRAAMQRVV